MIIVYILGVIFAIPPSLVVFAALLGVPGVGLPCAVAAIAGCIILTKRMKKDRVRKPDAGFVDGFFAAALGGFFGGIVGEVVFLLSDQDVYGNVSDLGMEVCAILMTPFILVQCYLVINELYEEKTEKKVFSAEEKEEVHEEPEVEGQMTASEILGAMIDSTDDKEKRYILVKLLYAYEEIEVTLKDNPDYENMEDIKKLREYYLPKALELSDRLLQGKCSEETKKSMEDALGMCAAAFKNINRKLIAADDLQTAGDLAVLKDTLAREGLLDSDFIIDEKDTEKDERDIIDLLIIKYLIDRKKEEETEKQDEPYVFDDADYYTDSDDDFDSDSDSYDSYEDDSDDRDDDSDSYDSDYDTDDSEDREESDFEDWLFNNDDERW